MAEFVQTMNDWRRMCDTHVRCVDCPIEKCVSPTHSQWETNFNELESKITEWAAEHPEPVYPTFAEWLHNIGVTISDQPFPAPNIPVYVFQVNSKMFDPIPADIAEKLGIKPKEG